MIPQRVSSIVTLILALVALMVSSARLPARAEEAIRLVFATELQPLSFDDAGSVRGVLVDIAREVFATRLGLEVDMALYPWERAQQMVQRGEADGFITIATPARAVYADCGRIPVLRAPLRPIIREDHPRRAEIAAAGSLEDLRPFSIVSYFGNGWAKQNLAEFEVFYAADFIASLRGLAQGRGDVAFATTTAGSYYMREFGLDHKLVMLPLVIDTFEYVLCLGKDSAHAGKLAEFDRVLEVMRLDGGLQPILERYGLKGSAFY